MPVMKVIGYEAMSGVGKTSGKAYAIGRLHTSIPLAPAMAGGTAKGEMGTTYDCPENLINNIKHLPCPIMVDVITQDQMKFGKRETVVMDLKPVVSQTVAKAGA